ncbi:type II toxin-antitoxin system VapC family toxin [Blastococcus sp. CT_GayMR16]|uniref:type II toxin-antitoxin system VapC family toxin n=1 Tax=Blastococcus sp. CT_GayMR16 TaxID=2559607 RepID=UPI001073DBBF|nr:type II toxin-antitoxin system VapC family toxin [Blastococcus sp. CT_GayMR16]TFV87384.1 PIN domain-containing protein [Blastococcus sp. CT_GayMR16]
MTIVIDASAVAAALTDRGADGDWARAQVAQTDLAAPSHMFVEVSNVLRRSVLSGWLGRDVAALAHDDLVQLQVSVFPFEPLAARVWELHPSVTPYDAGYVALAEALDVPVMTLDRRLARASGPACDFLLPS